MNFTRGSQQKNVTRFDGALATLVADGGLAPRLGLSAERHLPTTASNFPDCPRGQLDLTESSRNKSRVVIIAQGPEAMQVSVAKTYMHSLKTLPRSDQDVVNRTFMDFMHAPEARGHRLHALKLRERRFCSISPNMDLRIIAFKDGAQIIMVYVDHHDAAYRWAERRQLEIHPVTGAVQIVEIDEVVREVEVGRNTRPLRMRAPQLPLFAEESDEYLLSLGVPQAYLAAVRSVIDDETLEALVLRLPEEAAEALIELSAGGRPSAAPVSASSDIADALKHPDALRRFFTATDDAELARALDRPWAEWLVFLHPSQRLAVERSFGGPARVSGSAGTGKSVVAMHRAARLARAPTEGRILLTTFSRTLANRLAEGMDALLGFSTPERARVEVVDLNAYAMANASRIAKPMLAGNQYVDTLLRDAGRGLEGAFDPTFLKTEWDAVVDYWGLADFEAYRDIARTGRGGSLPPRQRQRLWEVFSVVRQRLADEEMLTFGGVCDLMRRRIEADGRSPFRHVVVDEAQDLGPRELKLVAALAGGNKEALFFSGDVGQRIYRWPFSWLSAGVDVRGRAQRLKVNYRTSAEIKRFSDRLLPGRLTEVDGEAEERSAYSVLHGPEPRLAPCPTVEAEVDVIADWVRTALDEGVAPSEIAILGRTRKAIEHRALAALAALKIEGAWLSSEGDEGEADRVNLVILQAAKGLEFRAVALVGCEDALLPNAVALSQEADPEARRTIEERELNLFYVGCTRARDRLLVTWSGTPSRFIAERLMSRP